jgi:hypothetical protein
MTINHDISFLLIRDLSNGEIHKINIRSESKMFR